MDTIFDRQFWSTPSHDDYDPEMMLAAAWVLTNPGMDKFGGTKISKRNFEHETHGLSFAALMRAIDANPDWIWLPDENYVWPKKWIGKNCKRGDKLLKNKAAIGMVKLIPDLSERRRSLLLEEYPELVDHEDFDSRLREAWKNRGQAKRNGATPPPPQTELELEAEGVGGGKEVGIMPVTLQEAQAAGQSAGVDSKVTEKWFYNREGNDCLTPKGRPLTKRNYRSDLKSFALAYAERQNNGSRAGQTTENTGWENSGMLPK